MSIFGPEDESHERSVQSHGHSVQPHGHSLNVEAIGHYIVWYNVVREKRIYYSVRKKIDLDADKLVEIKNGIKTGVGGEISLANTRLDSNRELYVMRFNGDMRIPFPTIRNNWSFILSFIPFSDHSIFNLICGFTSARGEKPKLGFSIDRTSNRIIFSNALTNERISSFPINSKQLIHLSIGRVSNTISLLVNGKPWRNYEIGELYLLFIWVLPPVEIGILSTYNRCLSKSEFVQHFIDYHVPNFTDDEVLI